MDRRCFLSALAAAPLWLRAADPEGFTPLFDGRTLEGWTVADGPEGAFYVEDGAIVGSPLSGYPAWLRTARQYENFEFRCEFFVRGWTDGGVYFHAPEHGHKSRNGIKISIFHQQDAEPRTNSMGSVYPLLAPRLVNVRAQGEWNQMRVRADWPNLKVWVNGALIHDVDRDAVPELRHRLRRGFIGLETLSYPLRFRNLALRELPSKEQWEVLFESAADLKKWTITESVERAPARFTAYGNVLHADGLGNLTTIARYRNFELQLYLRGVRHHNGGILFRRGARKPGAPHSHYEIQLHDVEEAHYPTGSLYHYKRSTFAGMEPEQWRLMQLIVNGTRCKVRLDGLDILDYDQVEDYGEGPVELQAHQAGRWIEYKQIRIRRL